MKVRKLAVALALAGGLGSGVAQALGLGEIELQSYLNEPLDAEINLRKSQGIEPDDVFVNIASDNDYQRVGIARNHFLSKLQFEVTTSRDGSLIVNVSSREPLREPYLNFLLEVTWPNGRLMREYAVLVDPPVYAEESGVQESVSVPETRSLPAPEPSRQQMQAPVRQASDTGNASRSGQRRTLEPTNPSDTLWKIAASTRPDSSVSMQQMMLAIQDLNPDAFMDGNINRLKRGEVLRLPEMDDIRSRSAAEANRQVATQNDAMASAQRTVDATESRNSTESDGASGSAGGDELRLIAAEDSESRSQEDGGSAGGDGQTAGGADAGSAVAMEELESARRENDELNSRVDDLQDQVQTLQRLLELKDTQLAEMQQVDDGNSEAELPDSEQPVGDQQMAGAEPQEGDDALADGDTQDGSSSDANASDVTGEESQPGDADIADTAGAEDAEEVEAPETGEQAEAEQVEPGEEIEVAATDADDAPQANTEPVAPAEKPAKEFPANVIDAITNNPLYQIALGGGLVVLLLLLLLLARRNANREKVFYEQLNGESDESSDTFDLNLDDEVDATAHADGDAMAEAEAYIAYGQMDKAAETLETAISSEPSRSDLRLMLLGVYADTQDRGSFEKQFAEIETLDDEQAIAEAVVLRERLDEAEAMPSIDDLESQLRSDSGGAREEELPADQRETLEDDFSDLDLSDSTLEEEKSDTESSQSDVIDFDLSGLETDQPEAPDTDKPASAEKADEPEEDEFSFDFDESEFETTADDEKPLEQEDELPSLDEEDHDLGAGLTEESIETPIEKPTEESEEVPEEASADDAGEALGDLDESFLDELDAELDKVAGEPEETASPEDETSSLDDLELDVSDEDLALMEEFADSGDSANSEAREPDVAIDGELGLEDALQDESAKTPEDVTAEAGDLGVQDDLIDLEGLEEFDGLEEESAEPPLASDAVDKGARDSAAEEIDETELGDDDDFDFLAGTDEAATKLDLARAYIEMGDADGARDILEEVILEGDDAQKVEAQDLLKNLS
ncbi:FimV/HubP family polar landmark protein [Marinobacter sp.]|uniref:FimV/HubP family polar landmark protein n=1 Tax=Marinobacter sp. TaxID=50741 RepID=UPI0034A1C31E